MVTVVSPFCFGVITKFPISIELDKSTDTSKISVFFNSYRIIPVATSNGYRLIS